MMPSSCQKKMMASCFQEHHQQSHLQNPIFDALYCEEDHLDGDFCLENSENVTHKKKPFTFLLKDDLLWDEDELVRLLAKEKKEAHLRSNDKIKITDGSLRLVRNEAVEWMLKVVAHYGFNAMTAVLAVNYYDVFVTSGCFQRDKPWMSQLAAVACVSIAAKVEETQVPLLLDFQIEEPKYLFEAKTIQRMELLVLSTLQWITNLATPISFIDHIARRFELINNLHWEFLSKCNDLILSVINDCRIAHYLPSVIAAATMIYVINETETDDAASYQNQIINVLVTSKEKVDECYKVIEEVRNYNLSHKALHKRRHERSPSGIIDAYLSSDSSVDSWVVSSSSPEPLFKRSRVQKPDMKLGSNK